jgi:hypothetical protein
VWACCDQSTYCRIRQLGTGVWRVVTSLHIATADSWVPMCGMLSPVCILQRLTVGYQCVACCHQSAYCNISQKCNGKKVQYFLRIKAQLRICMFVKFCDILPSKFANYLISSVANEIARWTVYSEMCLCPSVCCILKFIYIYIYISLNEILICILIIC